MRKFFLVAAMSLLAGSAFAQTSTGPAGQSDTTKQPAMSNSSKKMNDGTVSSTTGSNMSKDSIKKDNMKKENMSK